MLQAPLPAPLRALAERLRGADVTAYLAEGAAHPRVRVHARNAQWVHTSEDPKTRAVHERLYDNYLCENIWSLSAPSSAIGCTPTTPIAAATGALQPRKGYDVSEIPISPHMFARFSVCQAMRRRDDLVDNYILEAARYLSGIIQEHLTREGHIPSVGALPKLDAGSYAKVAQAVVGLHNAIQRGVRRTVAKDARPPTNDATSQWSALQTAEHVYAHLAVLRLHQWHMVYDSDLANPAYRLDDIDPQWPNDWRVEIPFGDWCYLASANSHYSHAFDGPEIVWMLAHIEDRTLMACVAALLEDLYRDVWIPLLPELCAILRNPARWVELQSWEETVHVYEPVLQLTERLPDWQVALYVAAGQRPYGDTEQPDFSARAVTHGLVDGWAHTLCDVLYTTFYSESLGSRLVRESSAMRSQLAHARLTLRDATGVALEAPSRTASPTSIITEVLLLVQGMVELRRDLLATLSHPNISIQKQRAAAHYRNPMHGSIWDCLHAVFTTRSAVSDPYENADLIEILTRLSVHGETAAELVRQLIDLRIYRLLLPTGELCRGWVDPSSGLRQLPSEAIRQLEDAYARDVLLEELLAHTAPCSRKALDALLAQVDRPYPLSRGHSTLTKDARRAHRSQPR